MTLSSIPLLSTAIAIVISWALFAILCSIIQEAIAQLKAERGRFMKKYMLQQLQDLPNGVNWGSLVYLHGTIGLLSRAPEKPTNDIPPRLFAEALVEVVGNAQVVQKDLDTVTLDAGYRHNSLAGYKAATLVLKQSDVVSFFTQSLNTAELNAAGKDDRIDEALVYKNLIQHLENWYNEFISRLNYWYKKKTRQRLFMLGVVLGFILNIDSIQLFMYFMNEPASRQAMISYYEKDTAALSAYAAQLETNGITQQADSVRNDIREYTHEMKTLVNEAKLPVGWQYNIFHAPAPGTSFSYFFYKILGYLITGFAASFGAPFWFDLLKKVYSKTT